MDIFKSILQSLCSLSYTPINEVPFSLQDLTGGVFEQNLASLNLREGVDFFHFN